MTTLGTEESGHYWEMAVVGKVVHKSENVGTVCQKKWPLCREVAITEGSTVFTNLFSTVKL